MDQSNEIRRLKNRIKELEDDLRMKWCETCETVSSYGECECTERPETAVLRRALDYAKKIINEKNEALKDINEKKEKYMKASYIVQEFHMEMVGIKGYLSFLRTAEDAKKYEFRFEHMLEQMRKLDKKFSSFFQEYRS